MSYSNLPTGCIFPTSGDTLGYDYKYNFQDVSLYYKQNTIKDFDPIYNIICRILNYNQLFSFSDAADRDSFYISLSATTSVVSGTDGSILFLSAGTFAEDNSALFWDSSNQYLGIGMNTPEYTLDVIGDVRVQGDVWISGSATTTTVENLNITDNIILINSGETGSGVTLGTSGLEVDRGILDNQLIIWNENTLAWEVGESGSTLEIATYNSGFTGTQGSILFISGNSIAEDNSNFFYDSINGYVGIGTTTPSSKLTISGATETLFNINENLLVVSGNGYVGIGTNSPATTLEVSGTSTLPTIIGGSAVGSNITYKSTTGVGTVAGIAHQWLGGTDGATVIATMLNNGYVGIGTDSPTHKLDVAGNININSSTSAYMYDGSVALKLAKGTDAVYTNTFVGEFAGNSSAEKQTALGYYAGYLNSGAGQTASGYYAGYQNTGAYQTASGYQAGYRNSGAYQTASGYFALIYNDGDYNTAFGNNAFNTWTDDISEDVDAVLYESNQVTITGHGFGAVGRILNLVATTTDTLPTGLSGIQQWEVVDANTLSCKTDTFSDAGVGTLTLTSNTIFTNSLALGNNAEPDASNQAVIGNSALTQVKTAGSIYSSGTGDNYFAGDVGIGTITSTAYLHIKAGTATASTAPLKLTTGINLTTPEAGTIEYDGCSFFITNVASQKAIDRTSDVALSTVTVQNTTGETTIWTGPMAANSLCAGNVFKFHANGLISSDSVGDLITIRIKVGGVTKATLEGAAKKLEDDHFHIDAVATQRTIGGSGSRAIHIDMIIDEIEYSVTSVATIDTTTNMDVTITAQWNNQDVGNILELYQGFMEYKN